MTCCPWVGSELTSHPVHPRPLAIRMWLSVTQFVLGNPHGSTELEDPILTPLKCICTTLKPLFKVCHGTLQLLLDKRAFYILISPLSFSHLPMTIKLPPLSTEVLLYYIESKSQTIIIGDALPLNSTTKDICCTFITARKKKPNIVCNI